MIADSRKKAFGYVIVYKLDRFARNRYDSAIYKHKLKQNNVKVISAMENIGDNPESLILESVLETSAEYYSLELAQKIKRGMRESALKGKFCGGGIPVGYKSIGGQLVLDEAKAPFVKRAFEQYAAGVPKRKVIAELNAAGLRTRGGKPYGDTALQVAFQNILAFCAGMILSSKTLFQLWLTEKPFTKYKSANRINARQERTAQK